MHGSLQGSILAPELFLAYFNDLLTSLPKQYFSAYADNITLVASEVSSVEAIESL